MLLNYIQHRRIVDRFIKKIGSIIYTNDEQKWYDSFNELTDKEQEELCNHFHDCQAITIVKKMNSINPTIHIPSIGNFVIIAQRYYSYIHKEELRKYTKPERRAILRSLFETDKPVIYNSEEHYGKLSVKPADVKRQDSIL